MRRPRVCLDPFPQCFPRGCLVGIIIVATEEVDLQVRRLAETGDLVSAVCDWTRRSIAGRFTFGGFITGGRDESDAERLDGTNWAVRGIPVEIPQW